MRTSRRFLTPSVLLALVLAMPVLAHAQSRAANPAARQDAASSRQDQAATAGRTEAKSDVAEDALVPKAGKSGKPEHGDQKARGEKKTDRVHPERELEEEEGI